MDEIAGAINLGRRVAQGGHVGPYRIQPSLSSPKICGVERPGEAPASSLRGEAAAPTYNKCPIECDLCATYRLVRQNWADVAEALPTEAALALEKDKSALILSRIHPNLPRIDPESAIICPELTLIICPN